jgi:hypothetical protein
MDRIFISVRADPVDDHRQSQGPLRPGRRPNDVALALTKEAFWMIALLSSIGVWAAIWAAAASMASAWLL